MTETLTIRTMSKEDLDLIFDMEQRCHVAPWSRQILSDCLTVGYPAFVLEKQATDGLFLVGYLIARERFGTYHILNFCIDKPYQQQGYGHYFLAAHFKSLEQGTIEQITLEVRLSNQPAIQLYQRLGFKEDVIKPAYYNDSHGLEDALVFKKSLKL